MLAEDIKKKIQKSTLEAPAVFLGFGSPMQAIDFDEYNERITEFISSIPSPRNILIITPFWQTSDVVEVSSCRYPDLIYDFEDGPETLKLLTYPCSGNIELAETVVNLLNDRDITAVLNEDRGLDKGAWVPLYVTFPDMDIPVVQISVPYEASPEILVKMGHTLSDLRKTGTMIIVVGNTVHEEETFSEKDKYSEADEWAIQLDRWIMRKILESDVESLLRPDLKTSDRNRYIPLLIMMGTIQQKDHIETIFEKFYYHNTSMRSFAFIGNY